MSRRARDFALLAALVLAAAAARAETLAIPGLSAPAAVYTDELGVPHVVAETLEDAARAQGYVHARDRFFQMDVSRHRGEGTLAELTGQVLDVLGSDSLLRPWGLRAAAVRSAELLGDEERALAQAYADGVNAWLATHPLPPEYAELELTRVRPWSTIDSLLVGKLLGWVLNVYDLTYEPGFTARREAYIAAGEAADPPFDGAALADVDTGSIAPLDPAATVPDAGGPVLLAGKAHGRAAERRSRLSSAAIELARRHGEALAAAPTPIGLGSASIGSNAWGVAAAKSATGTPLVANDGHVSLVSPSFQYEVHLIVQSDPEVGPIHLSGQSYPGIPLVVFGQTERLAWGVTNSYFDLLDYFADRLLRDAPACPTRFCIESAGALHTVEPSLEEFRRNVTGDGTPDNLVLVFSSPRLRVPFRGFGQIVEIEAPGFLDGTGEAETTALTVQCTLAHGTRDIRALLGFARAQDVFAFRETLKDFDAASANFVVADTGGNLAYFTSGEVPLRADLEEGTPLERPELVRDGSGAGNWVPDAARSEGQSIPFSVVPFGEMPQLVNPPAGFVASANNDPLGLLADGDPLNSFRPSKPGAVYYLSSFFDGERLGARAGRITQLLRHKVDAAEPMTVDDMKRFQGDTVLREAELVVPFIVSAFDAAEQPGAPAELAAFAQDPALVEGVGRLAAWDFSTPTGIPEGYDASDVDGVRAATVPPEEVAASIAATIYHAFLAPFVALTLRRAIDAVDPNLPRVGIEPHFIASLVHVLSAQPFTGLGGSGLDLFPGPAGLSAAERRDVALLQALRDGLDRLASPEFANAFGGSTSQDDYRWGKLHRLTLVHPLGGDRNLPPAAGFEDLGPGLPGLSRDGASGALNLGKRFALGVDGFYSLDGFDEGAGLRFVMAPGHPDAAPNAVLGFASFAGGSSGDSESPLYASQLPAWLTVDYHEVPVSEADVAGLPAENVESLPVSKAQRTCVQTANESGAKVGKAQGKEDAACLAAAAKGKEADPEACLTADAKGKLAKARDKAAASEGKKCVAGELPAFGYTGAANAADAGGAASLGLLEDLFGADLNAAVIAKAADKAGAGCQSAVLASAQAALETLWRETAKAKKSALAGKKGAAPAESGFALQEALLPVFAPSQQVAKALAKVEQAAQKKCGSVADLGAAFPGRCKATGATGDAASLGSCARERVLCRGCRSASAMDALALPCDGLDDGEVDDSCG